MDEVGDGAEVPIKQHFDTDGREWFPDLRSDADREREWCEAFVAEDVRRAKLTHNGLYLWKAISSCFAMKIPLSADCLKYIKATAYGMEKLLNTYIEKGDNTISLGEIFDVLQFPNGQGTPNAFKKIIRDKELELDAAIAETDDYSAEALQRVMQRHRINEEKQAKRRIRDGQKLLNRNERT